MQYASIATLSLDQYRNFDRYWLGADLMHKPLILALSELGFMYNVKIY